MPIQRSRTFGNIVPEEEKMLDFQVGINESESFQSDSYNQA